MAVATFPDCSCCDGCFQCRTSTADLTLSMHFVDQDCFCIIGDNIADDILTLSYEADLNAWIGVGTVAFCSVHPCQATTNKPITAIFTQSCGCRGFLRVLIDDCYDKFFTQSHAGFGVGGVCPDSLLGNRFCTLDQRFYSACTNLSDCCFPEPDGDQGCGQQVEDTVLVQWGLHTFDADPANCP